MRLTTTLQELGARQFLTKPLNSPEYSAAAMVLKALNNGGRNGGVAPQGETTRPPNPSGVHKPRQFSGGELRVLADRAELSGTTIITDRNGGQSLRVLERLARRGKGENYVHCSGEDLAESLEVLGGSGAVTSYIQTLRRNISKRLAKRGIECGREDVIGHDQEGYFLRDWIEVVEGGRA